MTLNLPKKNDLDMRSRTRFSPVLSNYQAESRYLQ